VQGHKYDRIRYGEKLSHPDLTGSRFTSCSWGDSWWFKFGEDDTQGLHEGVDIIHQRDCGMRKSPRLLKFVGWLNLGGNFIWIYKWRSAQEWWWEHFSFQLGEEGKF